MALLSATQGTPDRIWSLLRVLAAHGGAMSRTDLATWLNPSYVEDGKKQDETSAFNQTLQAAGGLGLIGIEDTKELAIKASDLSDRFDEFPHFVHSALSNLEKDEADHLLFEAFSFVVVQTHKKGGTSWIHALNNEEFASQVNQSLMASSDVEGDRVFNSTKLPHWRRWMEFLGLQVHLPSGGHFPYIAACLQREVIDRLPEKQEIHVDEFLNEVSRSMPYMDGGKIYKATAQTMQFAPPKRQCSPILSTAVRVLATEGAISLRRTADASDYVQLSVDVTGQQQSFNRLQVGRDEVFDA